MTYWFILLETCFTYPKGFALSPHPTFCNSGEKLAVKKRQTLCMWEIGIFFREWKFTSVSNVSVVCSVAKLVLLLVMWLCV